MLRMDGEKQSSAGICCALLEDECSDPAIPARSYFFDLSAAESTTVAALPRIGEKSFLASGAFAFDPPEPALDRFGGVREAARFHD